MANITRKERVAKLANQIRRADSAYYNGAEPLVSDSVYDEWKAKLRELSPNHKLLSSVGAKPLTDNTVTRRIMMGSLNNVRNEAELLTWLDKYPHVRKFMYSPKVDGLATELVYQDYEFSGGYTRGDGITGVDVTPAVLSIPNIPQHIDVDGLWVIRGESYVTRDDFRAVNRDLVEHGIDPFTLPRAMASGTLKLTDTARARKRKLSFIAWELVTGRKKRMADLVKESQRLAFVKDVLGIPTIPRRIFDRDTMDVKDLLTSLDEWRKELPYPIDGIVFSLNLVKELERAGNTGKFPKGKVAYKFKPTQVWSRLRDVTNQVGRTGKITPVAWFRPIVIDGSCVEKASIFNHEEIERLGMTMGCKVLVEKACDIIPQIVKAEQGADPEKIPIPVLCPRCHTTLIRKETADDARGTTVDLFCPNIQTCPAQLNGRLVNYLNLVGNLGFGPVIVAKLAPHIEHLYAIYDLPERTFRQTISPNNGSKLYAELHSNKKVPFAKFIQALGYEQLGESSAKIVAASFQSVKELLECSTIGEVRLILEAGGLRGETILPTISKSLFSNMSEIEQFSKRLTIIPYTKKTRGNCFTGMSVAITGKLSKERSVFQRMVEEYGGKYSSSVTSKTTLLLAGDGGGEKREVAEKHGIRIVDEETFMRMLND